jgi:hypothetical protein
MNEELKKRLSEKRRGKNNPFYGHHHTEKTKEIWKKQERGFKKGYIMPQEIKDAIHDTIIKNGSLKGENNPMYDVHRYGEESPAYGVKHSNDAIERSRQGRIKHRGIEREEWLEEKGFKSTLEYKNFVNVVMRKNGGLCYICGEKAVIAHHLTSYTYDKEHRFDPSWGVPLCYSCHRFNIHNHPLERLVRGS